MHMIRSWASPCERATTPLFFEKRLLCQSSSVLAVIRQKMVGCTTEIISAVCPTIFFIVDANSCEKSYVQFLRRTVVFHMHLNSQVRSSFDFCINVTSFSASSIKPWIDVLIDKNLIFPHYSANISLMVLLHLNLLLWYFESNIRKRNYKE